MVGFQVIQRNGRQKRRRILVDHNRVAEKTEEEPLNDYERQARLTYGLSVLIGRTEAETTKPCFTNNISVQKQPLSSVWLKLLA